MPEPARSDKAAVRALVAGWFSFPASGATAGDLVVRDLCSAWLDEAGMPHDLATAPPFSDGVDAASVDPSRYTHLVFVCGPWLRDNKPLRKLVKRFGHCRLVGLNLTMIDDWRPFDALLTRDGPEGDRPDLAFLAPSAPTPVVGVVMIERQHEYGRRARHDQVMASVERLLASRDVAPVRIDTRLDLDSRHLRTPEQVESLIARTDAVVTNRLHGTVFALRNGVPPLVIDAVAGGDKVIAQARTVGWPAAFIADQVTDEELARAFEWCLTEEARQEALRCRERARALAEEAHREFVAAMRALGDGG
jgi:hypothetical protein